MLDFINKIMKHRIEQIHKSGNVDRNNLFQNNLSYIPLNNLLTLTFNRNNKAKETNISKNADTLIVNEIYLEILVVI